MTNLANLSDVLASVTPKFKINDEVVICNRNSAGNVARVSAGTIKHVCIIPTGEHILNDKGDTVDMNITGHKAEYIVFLFEGGKTECTEEDMEFLPNNSVFKATV